MALYLFVSGYGPFMNITNNPSDELGKMFRDHFAETFQGTNIRLADYTSMPVTHQGVMETLEKWSQQIDQIRQAEGNACRFLCINIGVNAGIPNRSVNFERYCFNSRCFEPGNEGSLCESAPVYNDIADNQQMECKFDIESIVDAIAPYNPFAKINYDPGTYLCGYVYLRCLVELANDFDTHNFFVHIPDNFAKKRTEDFHFHCQTLYQFIIRYASVYHSNLAFGNPEAQVDYAEDQQQGGANRGHLFWRPVHYCASRMAQSVVCKVTCNDLEIVTQPGQTEDGSNFYWDNALEVFQDLNGTEAFELDVVVDGTAVGRFRVEVEQLMELQTIEEELDLSDENNQQTFEKVRMFFEFKQLEN